MEILSEFDIWEWKPVATLIDLCKFEWVEKDYYYSGIDPSWYVKALKLLIYAMLEICADIAYFVSVLSWYLINPTSTYVKDAKQIMRYLHRTYIMELVFCEELQPLVEYTDLN